MGLVAQLEPPDVIAQFGPADEPRIDQIGQIPKHGGLVEAERHQLFGDLSVADGRSCPLQPTDDRQTCRGGSQPHSAEEGSNLRNLIDFVLLAHADLPFSACGRVRAAKATPCQS